MNGLNDFFAYLILKDRLEKVSINVGKILSNIENLERNCSSALVINNETNYKNNIVNLKYNLAEEKRKIDKEILKEFNG